MLRAFDMWYGVVDCVAHTVRGNFLIEKKTKNGTIHGMKSYIFALVFLMVSAPALVSAGPIIRTGESVMVDEVQILEGNFYGVASTLTLSGAAEQDVYVLGGTVTSNGTIAEDLTVVGGTVHIHGVVDGDVRVVGGDVTIASDVKGDVAVLGNSLKILSTATVSGDVIFYGSTLDISGTVQKTLHTNAEAVGLYGTLNGASEILVTDTLVVGDRAVIRGDIVYRSPHEISRSPNAVIAGSVSRQSLEIPTSSRSLRTLLLELFTLVFTVIVVYQFFGRFLSVAYVHTEKIFWYGLSGAAFLLLVPVIAIALFVSMIGSALGILLLGVYLVMFVLAIVYSAVLLGVVVTRQVTQKTVPPLMVVTYGSVIWFLIASVPVVGPYAVFFMGVCCGGVLLFQCAHRH